MAGKRSNKCKHVFVKGPKAGKKCGKGCRQGDRCKDHSEKKDQYRKVYYEENIKKSEDDILKQKLKKIAETKDIRNITALTVINAQLNCKRIEDDARYQIKKCHGIKIFLGTMKVCDILRPKVLKMYNKDEITQRELDNAMDVDNRDIWSDNIKKNIKYFDDDRWLYKEFKREELKEDASEDEIIAANKRDIVRAIKQLEKLKNMREPLKNELDTAVKIAEALDKRRKELLGDKDEDESVDDEIIEDE
jgi:hypothetical protein